MPAKLVEDLKNPKLKWIVFINPPFATANSAGAETGKESKGGVSMTPLRAWMTREGYGEASRELFVQFLFRISKEFAGKPAHLCLFSKLKYLNSNNDQKIRDGFFQYAYCRGFIFPIKCFHGSKGNFPVGFLVWNLTQKIHLSKQAITLDVFNAGLEKVGTKTVPCVSRTEMLNKWCPRPKWDGHSVMPMFTSALNQQLENKDQRDHIAEGYLFSVVSKGDDFQNTNACFILSTPYANAGAFSVTAENFERAMVLHAVKKIPVATWTNDRDAFYAPKSALGGGIHLGLRGLERLCAIQLHGFAEGRLLQGHDLPDPQQPLPVSVRGSSRMGLSPFGHRGAVRRTGRGPLPRPLAEGANAFVRGEGRAGCGAVALSLLLFGNPQYELGGL